MSLRIELQPARGTGRSRENAKGGAGMPSLADMLLSHADADSRSDLVARDSGGKKFTSGKLRMILRYRDQCRKRHRADMQHAVAVHVVEFETLHGGSIHQARRAAMTAVPYYPTPRWFGSDRLLTAFSRRISHQGVCAP